MQPTLHKRASKQEKKLSFRCHHRERESEVATKEQQQGKRKRWRKKKRKGRGRGKKRKVVASIEACHLNIRGQVYRSQV